MIRFPSLIAGAAVAASALTLWAQVPIVQPSGVIPAEIPVIQARIAKDGPATSTQDGGPSQSRSSFLESLNTPPVVQASSVRVLPPIVQPGSVRAPAASTGKSEPIPVVTPGQVKSQVLPQSRRPGGVTLAPQLPTPHPDFSLPTAIAITPRGSQTQPGGQPVPPIQNPPTSNPLPQPAAPSVPEISIAASVPIVKSAAVATGPQLPVPGNKLPVQPPQIQEQGGIPIVRPELIALPPIRPGEEFPRMRLDPPATAGDQKNTRPTPSSPTQRAKFEPVPVGSGLTDSFSATAGVILPAQSPPPPSGLLNSGSPQLPDSTADFSPAGTLEMHSHASPHGNFLEPNGGGCPNCGGAGCSHCGGGGWHGLGNQSLLQIGGNMGDGSFGLVPCARNYLIADVLYWTRNGGDVIGTDFGGVYDYDWNFGGQLTLGTRTDPLYGRELVYFGLFELDAGHTELSPTGAIDARFNPTAGLGYGQTYAFFDGEEVTQTASSRLHSFQLNRTRLGWDVVQSHLGLRYIWFEDEYQLQSRNIFGESGRLALDARNQLFGPEVGVKLFYDVGRRISFSSHWKIGGYLNAYRSSTYLENDGVRELSNSDSGTGFSASFDLGANVHVHVTQRLRLRGGYGLLWLWDVASVSGNFPSTLTPASGTFTNDSESAIFHGANLGLEFYW